MYYKLLTVYGEIIVG